MGTLFNHEDQTDLRRKLRHDLPEPKRVLWNLLRGRRLDGYKFKRQFGILNYIVDFYCPEVKLVIEIDGDSHYLDVEAIKKDQTRDEGLKKLGITVLRFTNLEVMRNTEGVFEKIRETIGNLSV